MLQSVCNINRIITKLRIGDTILLSVLHLSVEICLSLENYLAKKLVFRLVLQLCEKCILQCHLARGGTFFIGDNMRKYASRINQVGVTKEIDNLGRLVIPKEMRRLYGLDSDVEVITTTEGILLRSPKYRLVKIKETKA